MPPKVFLYVDGKRTRWEADHDETIPDGVSGPRTIFYQRNWLGRANARVALGYGHLHYDLNNDRVDLRQESVEVWGDILLGKF